MGLVTAALYNSVQEESGIRSPAPSSIERICCKSDCIQVDSSVCCKEILLIMWHIYVHVDSCRPSPHVNVQTQIITKHNWFHQWLVDVPQNLSLCLSTLQTECLINFHLEGVFQRLCFKWPVMFFTCVRNAHVRISLVVERLKVLSCLCRHIWEGKKKIPTLFEGEQTILSLSLFAACCRGKTGRLLIPIINSWAQRIDATECQATDFCAVVHRLSSSLLSFVPISLPDSGSHSLSVLLSLIPICYLWHSVRLAHFLAPFFIILFLCYCLSPPCPFL